MIEDLRFVERPHPQDPIGLLGMPSQRILQMKVNGQWVDVPMGGEK